MKVYLLMRNYFNGCESWESVESIYGIYEDAIKRCDYLNDYFSEENSPCSDTSFYVQPRDVL